MAEETPTQKASRELAEAVFADPELAHRFELMAKETANRDPVPDDFSWLPPEVAGARESAFARFETLARKLVAVPKAAIDAQRKKA